MRQPNNKIKPDPKKIVAEFLRSGKRLGEFDRFYTKCVEEPILKFPNVKKFPNPNYTGIVSLPANLLMVIPYEPAKLNNDYSICQSSNDFGGVVLKTYVQR